MTSPAEQALQETTNVPNDAWRAQRSQYVSQAVSLMNQLASEMKAIPTKIDWSGPSRDAAEQRFVQYSAKVTQHADTLAAVDKADAQAAEAVKQAQQDYINLPDGQLTQAQADAANKDANFHPGAKDAAAQNAELAEARRQRAEADKQKLDSSMGSADSDLRSNVSWDFGDIQTGQKGDGGGYTPTPGGAPGGGGGSGNSGSVWGQGPTTPQYYNPNGPGGEYVIEGPGLTPPSQTGTGGGFPPGTGGGFPPPPGTGGGGGYQTPVNIDGPTTGTTGNIGGAGGGGFGGVGGTTGSVGGGGMGAGVGGLAGAGGIVAGGAGLAAGGLRSGGGVGGRFGSGGRAGASADGGVTGKTSGTGAGGRGGMGGAPGESVGSSGAAGGGRPGGMMGGGGGGGGGAGGGRGGISGASSGKYGVPKLGAEGGRGGAGGGRGGATGAAGAGGRGSGKGEDRDGDRTFLTEEDEENWYDGVVDDE